MNSTAATIAESESQVVSGAMDDAAIVSPLQRRQLEVDGFFITDVLFGEDTLTDLRKEFDRFWSEHREAAKLSGDALSIEQARDRPFMSQLDQSSDICRAFCHHAVFQKLSRELIGPDADLTWNQAIVKPPLAGGDNAFAWHQDPWYALHGDYVKDSRIDMINDPLNGITVWFAVSRTTVDNGTLWVLPGRHMEGLLPHVWSETKREWQGQFDTSWKIPAVLRAGQALVFRRFLPHASGSNVSSETRMAYQLGYSVPGIKLNPSPDVTPLIRNGKAA